MPQRIIIGISGASGAMLGVRVLEAANVLGLETHLVISKAAELTFAHETDLRTADVKALAHTVHAIGDMAAAISSGSFKTLGMIVAPCSVRSLSEVASGVTTTLLTRAADVVLKERRRLVLMVRESPLHLGHLRSMVQATEMGAIVAPPVPAHYTGLATVDAMVRQSAARALDLFGLDAPGTVRWSGAQRPS
ncbi:UbiX family flavin prenyltransferase [Zavarzinia sp. CC-PAN008]|uniref:UbiX family flavin prenyltransferase n=1 Tax=Zavarzinia sp. CC-PAN008 TaxID=3243332 RepID=UPI003F742B7D